MGASKALKEKRRPPYVGRRKSMRIFNLAVRNLSRNLRRTVAVVLTVAVGAGSLFVFDGFNAGIMNQYRENTIHARFAHGQVNEKGYRDQVYEKPWEHWMS